MSTTFTATFKSNKWTDSKLTDAPALSHAVLNGTFSGDLDGPGVSSYILAPHLQGDKGSCGFSTCTFDGQHFFDGTLLGKRGTFRARERGTITNGHLDGTWEIIPDTTTGELKGLTGTASYQSDFQGEEDQTVESTWTVVMPK